MCVAHGSRWQSTCSKEKKKNAGIFILLLLFPIFVFYFFFPLCLSSILFWQNCAGLFLTTYEKPERNWKSLLQCWGSSGNSVFSLCLFKCNLLFFFLRKKKKKDPGTIFGSSRRLRCAIWVKCRKATRNWPSHRLASLGHLVGLLVKHIEWSHFLSLSLVWGCWFDYPLGM